MRVIILKDYNLISEWVSQYIHRKITKTKEQFILGLPTGSTPIGVYESIIRLNTDFTNVTTFNMDEYIGLPPTHYQSYHYFMKDKLFNHINIDPTNINIPDGMADNIKLECHNYEKKIKDSGGIDLFLCGIGSDGHIAFNEPGSSFNSLTRVKTLTSQTVNDNSRFFKNINQVPNTAITVGIKTVMNSREIIIMASGLNKANAVQKSIEGHITNQFPCTITQSHPNAIFVIDSEAASELKYKTCKYYLDLQKKIDIYGDTINNSVNKHIMPDDRVLITSPHPDDDVIGMGGLMDMLPFKENVRILYMTNGQGGIRPEDNYGPYTRIKEAISAVKILGYEKTQVIHKELPFYSDPSRTISQQDSIVVDGIISDFTPNHIFICSDPDPKKTHIHCLHILKNCNIDQNTKIWLYKSAWQRWPECKLRPNIDVCVSPESFQRKLMAIDMHISQINPPVVKSLDITSFTDIARETNRSVKYFGQYCEKFHMCLYSQFLQLTNIY